MLEDIGLEVGADGEVDICLVDVLSGVKSRVGFCDSEDRFESSDGYWGSSYRGWLPSECYLDVDGVGNVFTKQHLCDRGLLRSEAASGSEDGVSFCFIVDGVDDVLHDAEDIEPGDDRLREA